MKETKLLSDKEILDWLEGNLKSLDLSSYTMGLTSWWELKLERESCSESSKILSVRAAVTGIIGRRREA